MDPTNPIYGKFYNLSELYVPPPTQPFVDYIDVMKSSNYRNNFKLTFDESLNNLTTHHMLLYTNQSYELSLFNNWNFTKFHYWDMFLYEDQTNKLFETNSYKIG